jgi:hypothetical protein
MKHVASHKAELAAAGTMILPRGLLFSEEELAELNDCQNQLPEEYVSLGDAGEPNDLYVRRMMIDISGQEPKRVNQPVSDKILDLLNTPERAAYFAELLDAPKTLRRCQLNRMVENSFIGVHRDVDSNPDYDVAVVIQLGERFEGGEFVVHKEGTEPNVVTPTYGTVVISNCEVPHEVRKVTQGERSSLVYFYSGNSGVNERRDA